MSKMSCEETSSDLESFLADPAAEYNRVGVATLLSETEELSE